MKERSKGAITKITQKAKKLRERFLFRFLSIMFGIAEAFKTTFCVIEAAEIPLKFTKSQLDNDNAGSGEAKAFGKTGGLIQSYLN